MEIVFGPPDILGDMASYLHFQELLLKELIDATKSKDYINKRIESAAIKLHVVQDIISHEQLFLLKGEAGTRVITGSANFSDRAFSGSQNEGYVCFDDDPAAWEHFKGAYERIRDRSTTSIIERDQIEGEFDAKDLPALSPARKDSRSPQVIVVQDGPPDLTTVHKAVRSRPPRRYGGISSAIETKGSVAKINRQTAQRAVRYVKSNSRTQEENPEEHLSIHPDSGLVALSGKELDLNVPAGAVETDVHAWLEYFSGYQLFKGQREKLARDYFMFWSWFYAGPFVCDLRNSALARGEDVWDYRDFGLLYGKSNCGKSELVKTLLLSMGGKEGFPPNDWFTKGQVPVLMEQKSRYPLVFDDIDKIRFGQHGAALIKYDPVRLKEYTPVVLSMNAGQDTFDSELRKRALIVHTGASLPDHTGEARRLGRRVKQIEINLGTALYKEYLSKMLRRLRRDREEPFDTLEISSSVLREIISEYASLPDWLPDRHDGGVRQEAPRQGSRGAGAAVAARPRCVEQEGRQDRLPLRGYTRHRSQAAQGQARLPLQQRHERQRHGLRSERAPEVPRGLDPLEEESSRGPGAAFGRQSPVSHGRRLGHPDWLTLIEFGRVENDQPRDHRHGVSESPSSPTASQP